MTELKLLLRSHKAEILGPRSQVSTGTVSSFYASFAWGPPLNFLVIGRTQFLAVSGLRLWTLRSHLPFSVSRPAPQQAGFAFSRLVGETHALSESLTSGKAQFLLSAQLTGSALLRIISLLISD